MESENGKIIIRKTKKGKLIFEVDLGGKKPMTIPSFYDIKDNTLNNKECKVFREKGQIKKILVDDKEILKKANNDNKSKKKYNQSKKNYQNYKTSNQGYKIKDSFDIQKTKIPKDTRVVLNDLKDIDNFNLKLNKFARFESDKPIFFKTEKGKVQFSIYPNFGDFKFKKNITKQKEYIKAIFKDNIKKFILKTNYRLVIGSEQSIYETSIRLHHIYGIPYIPASAIKGVVRSYYILEKFANKLEEYKDRYNKFEEEVLFKDNDFKKVFGSQEQEGKIIFFDAFPITKPKIKIDIMNPHYGDYYSEGKAPTDTKNPIPINFLTVEETEFKFFIASKDEVDESFITLFKKALQNHGIGGKTAVGYGYFEEIKK